MIKNEKRPYNYEENVGRSGSGFGKVLKFEGAWYYFQNALYTPSFTGFVPFDGSLFYVRGGTIDWSYNGVAEYNGLEYTVENGVAK